MRILVFFFFLVPASIVRAQIPDDFVEIKMGISLINEILPEGLAYNPTTLLGSLNLWQNKGLTIYGEYQVTQAQKQNGSSDFEFGLNFGLAYAFRMYKGLIFELAVGSGPHYITIQTSRQASGFIFSDNFQAGFRYNIPRVHASVSLGARWRHISNAGLESPNGGIDNGFLVVGIASKW